VEGQLADDTITRTYNGLSRVVTRAINGAANTTTQVYDALGRVTTETNVLGTFTYAYVGLTGRLQLVTYPNGQTSSYTYDGNQGDQRLQTIHHRKPDTSTLSKFDYTYDAAGNILTWQQQADSAAPTVWVYGYDRADQLTSAVHQTTDPTPAILTRYAYTYDQAGNRTSEQIDDAVTLATHDSLNRLLTHAPGGPLVFQGTLNEPGTVTVNGQPAEVDAVNRFRAAVPVTAGTTTVTIQAVDASGNATEAVYEVDQAGTGKTFTYDANGNMTSDGTRTFEWDARNQLVAVNVGTHRSEFGYDGRHRRVRVIEKDDGTVTVDRRFVWAATRPTEERDAGGSVRRFFTDGEASGASPLFYTSDHLGSTRESTDGTAAIRVRYDYDPWGRQATLVGAAEAHVGFTRHVPHAPSGVVLSLHRAYVPEIGRWISEDPLGVSPGPNRYQYVENSPAVSVDPLGLRLSCTSSRTSRDVTTTSCAGNPAGCTWGEVSFRTTGCREQRDCPGKWGFDATVALRIEVQFRVDRTLPSSDTPGATLEEHEELHVRDYQAWCSSVGGQIQTDGFPGRQACQRALDDFGRRIRQSWDQMMRSTTRHDATR